MNFEKNKLINQVLIKNFETWQCTQGTATYVSEKYLNKIDKMIFRNLEKQMKEAEIYHLMDLQDQGYKLGIFQKLRICFSGLRPLYNFEKKQAEEILKQVIEQENVDQEDLVEQKEEKENGENRQKNS